MRKLYLILSFFVMSILTAQTTPFIEWQKSLGGSDNDIPRSIQQTSDGGYIMAGDTSSTDGDIIKNQGYTDAWIIKLNSNGNTQWQKTLGGSKTDFAQSIRQTSDGGYIIAGTTHSKDGDVTANHGNGDIWLVKLDANGNMQWQKSLGGSKVDIGQDIRQTSDGGYIIAGSSQSSDGDLSLNHGGFDYWVIKTDSNGNIQWQKSLGGSGHDLSNSIQQTSDGGYIVAGNIEAAGGNITESFGKEDYWVIKLDSYGNTLWQKTIGGIGDDYASDIQQTSDGGYIVAGSSTHATIGATPNYPGTNNYWIVKLSDIGDIQWHKLFGGSISEQAYSIQQASDGGYIIAGHSKSNNGQVTINHGKADYWVIKINGTGELQWQKSLGGLGEDVATCIQQTADKGFIISGYTESNDGDITGNHGQHDGWIVKLSPEQSKTPEVPIVLPTLLYPILYPNPAKDFIYVDHLPVDVPTEIEITDMAGRKIFSQKYQEEKIKINTSAFASEAYLVQVKIKTVIIISEKVIINK